jgi:hypothetical protein
MRKQAHSQTPQVRSGNAFLSDADPSLKRPHAARNYARRRAVSDRIAPTYYVRRVTFGPHRTFRRARQMSALGGAHRANLITTSSSSRTQARSRSIHARASSPNLGLFCRALQFLSENRNCRGPSIRIEAIACQRAISGPWGYSVNYRSNPTWSLLSLGMPAFSRIISSKHPTKTAAKGSKYIQSSVVR